MIGGVIIFPNEHFIKVNGYSNEYWGWGGEDDDMYYRLQYTKINFARPVSSTVYTMLSHKHQEHNPNRFNLLNKTKENYKRDGLNSLNYKLNGIVKYSLFTHLLIDVKEE